MPAARKLVRALVLLALLTFGSVPGPALAQSAAGQAKPGQSGTAAAAADATPDAQKAPDYAAWDKVARQAESAIAANRLSNRALDELRARIVDWRGRFQTAQDANKTRIATLQTQIDALGPAPKDGETEAPEIVQKRKELNAQMADLRAPGQTADEAYTRADGIVREIDALVRTRHANALMQLWPSPLLPTNWPAAVDVVTQDVASLTAEVTKAWSVGGQREQFRANLPIIVGLLALALILILRGRGWMERLTDRLQGNSQGRSRQVWALLASFGQILVPFVGMIALVQAIAFSDLIGPVGEVFVRALMAMGLSVFAAAWLGGQIFPRTAEAHSLFDLSPERRAEGRIHFTSLGALVALDILRRTVEHEATPSDAASAVLAYPMMALSCIALFRTAQLMLRHVTNSQTDDTAPAFRDQVIRAEARAIMAVSVVAPVLGAVGYVALATAIVYPTVLSMALICLLVVIQRLIDDLYAVITRAAPDQESGLVPTLLGFALVLVSLPVFALIWGARVADLLELWTQASAGFTVGSTHISPANFLTFAVLFVIGVAVTRLVQGALKATVLPKTKIDLGGQNAIRAGVGYLGIILAALIAITGAGIDLSSLAIVAGALSVGIGFGLQNIVSNFVSGLILLIERPVSEGDWIDVGGIQGTVRSISVRSTRIETFDRSDVIVPNSNLITGVVTNMTKFSRIGRLILPVGVAYGTDTRKVDEILRGIAEAHPLVVLTPPPLILFAGFGADSLDFEIRVILRDVNFVLNVRNELNHQIAEKFAEEGIEIPFAQRDIWLRNPEALHPRAAAAPAAEPGSGAPADPLATGPQPVREVPKAVPVTDPPATDPPAADLASAAKSAPYRIHGDAHPETGEPRDGDSGAGDGADGPGSQR